jgi:hypothetical protein
MQRCDSCDRYIDFEKDPGEDHGITTCGHCLWNRIPWWEGLEDLGLPAFEMSPKEIETVERAGAKALNRIAGAEIYYRIKLA